MSVCLWIRFRRTDGDEFNPQVSAVLTSDPYKFQNMLQSSPFEAHSDTYQRTSALASRRQVATEELTKLIDKAEAVEKAGKGLREPLWISHTAAWDKAKAAWSSVKTSNAPKQPAPVFSKPEDDDGKLEEAHASMTSSHLAKLMAEAEKISQERGKSKIIPPFIAESAMQFTRVQRRSVVFLFYLFYYPNLGLILILCTENCLFSMKKTNQSNSEKADLKAIENVKSGSDTEDEAYV